MASVQDLKRRVRSVKNTRKITKAMELIAASRIQKALARVRSSTPYARALTRAVSAVATYSNEAHPLTVERAELKRAAIVVLTSDRGLAGAFNSQILREASELRVKLESEGKEVDHYLRRVEAERQSQAQLTDQEADEARIKSRDVLGS